MSDSRRAPDGPLGEPILSVALANAALITIRPEVGSRRLWFQEEGTPRPPLLLADEPQVCPVGRPLRFLAVAGLFEDLPDDVQIVQMRLGDRRQSIQAKTSEQAWILLLPMDEMRQGTHLAGELVWHRLSGEPYRRRTLESLRGLTVGSRGHWADRQGTAYGHSAERLNLLNGDCQDG